VAARCFCGCGEKVPWRLQIVTDLGEGVRQRRRDLEGLLDAGLNSPRAEKFVGVMIANENVLARSIHNRTALTAEMGGRTSDVLVVYELLFGAEALSRSEDAPSDEVLREQLGVDIDDLEASLVGHSATSEWQRFRDRRIPLRRESALE